MLSLSGIVHPASIEFKPCIKWLREVKKIKNYKAQKVVTVAYRRWSFTRGSNCTASTRKRLVFWIGGRLREVVALGGSTVFYYR